MSQTPAGITKLVKDLAPFELTKAEKLQVVNLAPTEPVELYVVRLYLYRFHFEMINIRQIVEELEDRLGDRMDDILTAVRASLDAPPPGPPYASTGTSPTPGSELVYPPQVYTEEVQVQHVFDPNEVFFDDTGEGAGVEGDLDMEED